MNGLQDAMETFCGRIFSSTVSPWIWRPYKGANPHTLPRSHQRGGEIPSRGRLSSVPWKINL